MNGSIVRVMVAVGQNVAAGAQLVVLEAMKMEHSLRAPRDGVVKAVFGQEGDMVEKARYWSNSNKSNGHEKGGYRFR